MLTSIAKEREKRALRETERNAEAIRARCQTLTGFVREAWPILEPRTTYQHGWHIDAICAHLEAEADTPEVAPDLDLGVYLVPMSHPDGGTCDLYETDDAGRILVPVLEVGVMQDHGFFVSEDN